MGRARTVMAVARAARAHTRDRLTCSVKSLGECDHGRGFRLAIWSRTDEKSDGRDSVLVSLWICSPGAIDYHRSNSVCQGRSA
jgi:hypothetical protein